MKTNFDRLPGPPKKPQVASNLGLQWPTPAELSACSSGATRAALDPVLALAGTSSEQQTSSTLPASAPTEKVFSVQSPWLTDVVVRGKIAGSCRRLISVVAFTFLNLQNTVIEILLLANRIERWLVRQEGNVFGGEEDR